MGIVVDIAEDDSSLNFKKVYSVLDEVSFFNEEMIKLILWMKEKYFCTYFDAIKTVLPSNIDKKSNFKFKIDQYRYKIEKQNLNPEEMEFLDSITKGTRHKVSQSIIEGLLDKGIITIGSTKYIGEKIYKYVRIRSGYSKPDYKTTKKQKIILEFLENVKYASVKELRYFTGCTETVVKNLAKKGCIEYFERIVNDDIFKNNTSDIENSPIILTDSQDEIYKRLCKDFLQGSSVHLLHGITGSGKTLLLLKFIDYVLSRGKGIIYMVPEICLTAQVVRLFKSRYGENVAIMHSGLSYRDLRNGNV